MKNIILTIGIVLGFTGMIFGFIYLQKNLILCKQPATREWDAKVTVCTEIAGGTYSSRCNKYEEQTERRDNSVTIEQWKTCPVGFNKID